MSVLFRARWLGVFAALASGCYRASTENSNATASSSAVPVVRTEVPAVATSREETSEPPPSEPPRELPPISLEAPVDVATPPRDAIRRDSGLVSKVLKRGTGTVTPTDSARLKVHYAGWTKDGKRFDSSVERNEPFSFKLEQVIPGFREGVELMVVGERRRLWIPARLAYGENPRMKAPAGDLTFDIELLEIIAPPETPPEVSQAPADAVTTPSGLAYKILQRGAGTTHPIATDRVTVHYTGWTVDGTLFDSSVTRGSPSNFGLDQVIKGWTEGVQLMVVGDKMRFWIPADLAYGDSPAHVGAPGGMLVFDIELLGIN